MSVLNPDFTTKYSPWPVDATVSRLEDMLARHGITIFATIDQRAAAQGAGLDLRETVLILYGNPGVGTPIMDAEPLAGLDLPLKLLVWDDEGHTRVTYLNSAALAARYDLSDALAAPLAGSEKLVDAALADTDRREGE